jgi:uncharacterized protein YjeT (DUF2065 family)
MHADEFLSQLRACVDEKAHDWRLRAASTVLVLGELIFGASPAWADIAGWRQLDAQAWHINEAGMRRAGLVSTAAAAVDEVMAPVTFEATEGTLLIPALRSPVHSYASMSDHLHRMPGAVADVTTQLKLYAWRAHVRGSKCSHFTQIAAQGARHGLSYRGMRRVRRRGRPFGRGFVRHSSAHAAIGSHPRSGETGRPEPRGEWANVPCYPEMHTSKLRHAYRCRGLLPLRS